MWSLGRSTLFSRPRPAFVSLRTLNSISLGHVSPCLCLDDDEFLPWLRRKSGVEISSSLKIGRSEYGRSLFASKFIEEGECILKIPYSSLTPDKVFPEFKSLPGDDVSSKGKLALALLAEEKLGWASEWAPYVACLPRPGELHSMVWLKHIEAEVEVRSERGRGFPLPLRAFARVLTVTTPQELARMSAEAVKGDGRLARFPLENTNKEIEAHRLLLAEITPLIEERFSSISLLESESSSINCGQLKHRRKLARDLLNGELRVLRSAASWLTRYCATLSAGFQS